MRVFRNASIMPMEGTMDAFIGGVFDTGGEFVADSVIYRGHAPELREHSEHLRGTYIYCR